MINRRILVLLLGDIGVLFFAYVAAALILRQVGWLPYLDLDLFLMVENGLLEITAVSATVLLGLYALGLYERIRVTSVPALLQDLLVIFGVAFLMQALVSYSKSVLVLPRWIMLFGSLGAAAGLALWRVVFTDLIVRRTGRQRVLFLGNSDIVRRLQTAMEQQPEAGFTPIGVIGSLAFDTMQKHPVAKPGQSLAEAIQSMRPDRVAVADSVELDEKVREELLICSMRGLSVESVGTIYEEMFGRVALETITLNQLVFSPAFRPKPWVVLLQEIYGRLIALVGILLTWPLMLAAAIAVRVDSGSPILFRQTRIGKNGKHFVFLKFRSMHVNNDAIRARENDPRITRVGKWIRLTRIDELPQFFNVIRGDMTLVGPRPEMPEFEADLIKQIPLYPQRHRVKPGITGWAQIHHVPEDSLESTERKLEYDLYYIKHLSPMLDFLTIFHTAKAILLRVGAR